MAQEHNNVAVLGHLIGVDLRREFDNFGSAARTVCSRWSRGVYRISKRPSEPCVVDSRGQSVRSLGMTQTFLTDAEVDQLVTAYEAGATLRGLAKQFHIHRLPAAAHLARRGVPVRRAGLDSVQAKEAARLYQSGWTLVQLGRRFEVDAQTVRRTIARQGVSIRPGGRPHRGGHKVQLSSVSWWGAASGPSGALSGPSSARA